MIISCCAAQLACWQKMGRPMPAFGRHVCKLGMAAVLWLGEDACLLCWAVRPWVSVGHGSRGRGRRYACGRVSRESCGVKRAREREKDMQRPDWPPSRDASEHNTTCAYILHTCASTRADRPRAPIGSYRFLHILYRLGGRAMLACIKAGLGRYPHLLGHPTSSHRRPACSLLRYCQPISSHMA